MAKGEQVVIDFWKFLWSTEWAGPIPYPIQRKHLAYSDRGHREVRAAPPIMHNQGIEAVRKQTLSLLRYRSVVDLAASSIVEGNLSYQFSTAVATGAVRGPDMVNIKSIYRLRIGGAVHVNRTKGWLF
jgi:hypothetical protein